jgi:integrase
MRQRPHGINAATWGAIRALLLEVVVNYQPNNDHLARRLTSVATHFAVWAVRTLKAPIVASDIFTYNSIRKYVLEHSSAPGTRLTRTSQLNQLALAASGKHIGQYPQRGMPNPAAYTSRELANIRSWARSRPEHRRDNTMLLLALIGGAGLRTSEAVAVRVRDLHIDADTVTVTVTVTGGSRPRTLPLIHEWAALAAAADHKARPDDQYLVLPQVNGPANRRDRAGFLCAGSGDNPNLAKLRDTWVITMLDRLPTSVLVHAAGYTSTSSLHTRYGQFAIHADDIDAAAFHHVMVEAQR